MAVGVRHPGSHRLFNGVGLEPASPGCHSFAVSGGFVRGTTPNSFAYKASQAARPETPESSGGVQTQLGPASSYRVRALSGFLGVQFRRSKRISDRHKRYAPAGNVVRGVCEDGVWLRISPQCYLPLEIDGRSVLEYCSESPRGTEPQGLHRGIPCCTSRSPAEATPAVARAVFSERLASHSGKVDYLAVAQPGPGQGCWLCAVAPAASVSSSCDVVGLWDTAASCDTVISSPSSAKISPPDNEAARTVEVPLLDDGAAQALVAIPTPDLWDAAVPSSSPRCFLPLLPEAASALPERGATGDAMADAAERLLARVVDPFSG